MSVQYLRYGSVCLQLPVLRRTATADSARMLQDIDEREHEHVIDVRLNVITRGSSDYS
jgi:hypothetical protein